ncbi:ABC transporter ATP-binding protein [Clostridiaceae bacterium M8S5]|nr:ABC transporter ATP-binding protein [Clostridiaceae bacterium M8S5]
MLNVKNLCKSYTTKNNEYQVLNNLSFDIKAGEFVAIMGASGSGKTTLLNSIARFIPINSGEIMLNNMNISKIKGNDLAKLRNNDLGFVFQDFMLFDGLTVYDNICMPQILSNKNLNQMEILADKLCDLFDISHIKHKYPAEISGGEKQRTAVARALINNPFLILADEPTGNLDSKSSKAVIDSFIRAKNELSATIFMVTHDSYAASFCDRVIVLKDGMIYKELVKTNNRTAFLDKLLATLKELGGK